MPKVESAAALLKRHSDLKIKHIQITESINAAVNILNHVQTQQKELLAEALDLEAANKERQKFAARKAESYKRRKLAGQEGKAEEEEDGQEGNADELLALEWGQLAIEYGVADGVAVEDGAADVVADGKDKTSSSSSSAT